MNNNESHLWWAGFFFFLMWYRIHLFWEVVHLVEVYQWKYGLRIWIVGCLHNLHLFHIYICCCVMFFFLWQAFPKFRAVNSVTVTRTAAPSGSSSPTSATTPTIRSMATPTAPARITPRTTATKRASWPDPALGPRGRATHARGSTSAAYAHGRSPPPPSWTFTTWATWAWSRTSASTAARPSATPATCAPTSRSTQVGARSLGPLPASGDFNSSAGLTAAGLPTLCKLRESL